jgi:hypothetical protein
VSRPQYRAIWSSASTPASVGPIGTAYSREIFGLSCTAWQPKGLQRWHHAELQARFQARKLREISRDTRLTCGFDEPWAGITEVSHSIEVAHRKRGKTKAPG